MISDAEVADVAYTAFAGTPLAVTARLIVRRVRDRNTGPEDEMFTVWRHHPFFTNTAPNPAPAADITHRQHAIIETLFGDLIDGPLGAQAVRVVRREQCLGRAGRDHPQRPPRGRRPGR